ncbi:MAG: acyltransferase [Chitinophagales bacterium]|nr:acyltransferase [Chitinophagales bacterium]
MEKIYFKGLNGIRFIAAFMVIVAHIEGFKKFAQLPNIRNNNIISQLGPQGVKIFFVLSGFLITYLLLSEVKVRSGIDIKKFYIRRILRIWPLYFFIALLGFFVLPQFFSPDYFPEKIHPHFDIKLLLTFFMLPNVVYLVFGHMFSIGVLWSIGTEEQFYLVWPHLINRIAKNLQALALLLFGILSVKVACEITYSMEIFTGVAQKTIWVIQKILDFDCMTVGGIFAFIYFSDKKKILDVLYSKGVQIAVLVILFSLFLFNPKLYSFSNLVYSLLYGVLILNVATNPGSILSFENKALDYCGQISYGIYMYHSIFVALGIWIVRSTLLCTDSILSNLFLYPFAILCSIGIAALSYHFLEKPILHYKEKFMVVKSGKG